MNRQSSSEPFPGVSMKVPEAMRRRHSCRVYLEREEDTGAQITRDRTPRTQIDDLVNFFQ